jgi:hypothetical protein
MSLRPHNNPATRQSLEEGPIIIEKYDENGKLIKKTPPGLLPFGEMA